MSATWRAVVASISAPPVPPASNAMTHCRASEHEHVFITTAVVVGHGGTTGSSSSLLLAPTGRVWRPRLAQKTPATTYGHHLHDEGGYRLFHPPSRSVHAAGAL